MKVKMLNSPYGDTGVEYNNDLEMINHFVLQLESFRANETTPSLEADIEGYKELLKSKSIKNAENFLDIKMKARIGQGPDHKNNLEVIKYMKDVGIWE